MILVNKNNIIMIEKDGSNRNGVLSMLSQIHNKLAGEIVEGGLKVPLDSQEINIEPKSRKALTQSRNAPESRSSPLFKSQFSPQDKKKMKKLKEKIKVFEKSLEAKSQEATELQKILTQNEKRQQKLKLKEEWQHHREAVLVRKQQRWLQKKAEELIVSQAKKDSLLSNKKILYQQLQRDKELREEQQEKARSELLKILSQQRRNLVNISKLADHEKNYLQTLKGEKQDRMRKIQEIREATKLIYKSEINNSLKSKFYKRIVTEAQDKKRALESAQEEKKKSKQKMREFLQKVRSESLFQASQNKRLRNKTASKQQSASTIVNKRNLTQIQLRQMGNRFLRDSLNHIIKSQEKRSISTELHPIQPEKKYDYIDQLRQKRIKTQGDSNSFILHEGKIEKILASSIGREEKIEKLKKLAHRLEAGPSTADTDSQLQKIHAKMRILDATLKARE